MYWFLPSQIFIFNLQVWNCLKNSSRKFQWYLEKSPRTASKDELFEKIPVSEDELFEKIPVSEDELFEKISVS